jgi:uncharacterized pyridoxamine 5'-phosphate oxidase family protein
MLEKLAYKVQHRNDGIHSDKNLRIYSFLRDNPIAVMSSVGPNGYPHGVVIYFSINKQCIVSFLTKAGTKKYENIKHNNRVMLTVFEPKTQTTVQITGQAEEITDSYDVNLVANKTLSASLKTSDSGMPPPVKLLAGEYVAFNIEPFQIRMAVFARPDPGDYRELFETIEYFELKDNPIEEM